MSALPAGEGAPQPEPDLYRTLFVANAMMRTAVEVGGLAKASLVESLDSDNDAMVQSSALELMATGVDRDQVAREATQYVRRELNI
jgi:hypothetical protein